MSDLPATEAVVDPKPLVLEPVDIQHDTDPAEDHGAARRIPHLGHAILFFSIAYFFLNLSVLILFAVLHISLEAMEKHQGIGLVSQALSYIPTLLLSAWLFPRLWRGPFLQGIQWNFLAVRRRWYWVVGGAVLLSAAVSVAVFFIPAPSKNLLDDLITTPRAAWLIGGYSVLIAPLMEEIAFRGFLLPAFATAYDWLALERTPAGLQRWKNSAMHSTSALIFAAVFSSIPFALLHAGQLSHAWGALGVLYVVSLILSFVRIRTHSVACSTLMHATYNLSLFVVFFVSSGGFHHLESLSK
jgi:membrane protease YdiL (CAAX protease family)